MKKKLLSIILMIALVISTVVAVVACQQPSGVENAAEAFRKQYVDEDYTKASRDLLGSYTYEGVVYTITWTASSENIKFTTSADGKTVTLTATRTAEVQNYTLTATLSDGEGNTKAVEFRASVPANPNAGGQYGDPFFLYMDQINLGKIEWLKNTIASNIAAIETSDKKEDAIEYYFEDVEGQQGKKLFFLDGSTKKYVTAVADGQYQNVDIASSTHITWTINEDKVLVTTINDKQYFLGTNGTYFTATMKELKDIATSFPVKQALEGDVVVPAAVITVSGLNENCTVTITDPTPTDGKVVTTIGATIKFTVTPATNCTVGTVKLAGKEVDKGSDGTYTAKVEKSGTITVEVTNPNAREEKLAKRISINNASLTAEADGSKKAGTIEGVVITNLKNESTTKCSSGKNTDSVRLYRDSTLKLEYSGMLRVVFTMDNGYGAEGFADVQITGAKIYAEGTKVVVVFDSASNELTVTKLAAQIRVSQIEIYTADGEIQTEIEHEGTEADPYTATDALLKAQALELDSGKYSQDKYWTEAYVVSVKTATVSGNTVYDVGLADSIGGEKKIDLYHGNLATGSSIPYVGDKVRVIGHLTRYNSTLQFGGSPKAYPDGTNGVFATVEVLEVGNGSIRAESNENVTITITNAVEGVLSGTNGTKVTFTVAVDEEEYKLVSVKVNGADAKETATKGTYEVTLSGDMKIVVEVRPANALVDTFDVKEYATAHSWTKGSGNTAEKYDTAESTVAIFKIEGGGNDGKYYENDSAYSWRLYSSGNGTLTITAKTGYNIKSVTIVYSSGSIGVNDTQIASGTSTAVTGNAITFKALSNSQIQQIVIEYEVVAA